MRHDPRRIIFALCLCLLLCLVNIAPRGYSQSHAPDVKKKNDKESYERPAPTRPIRPEIPGVNRNTTERVFLEYADSLYSRPQVYGENEFQILKGNVKFRQAGMYMYCDSAYYFPEFNSLDAFGNVKMEQGDTLFVFSDVLYFDGETQMARLRYKGNRQVRLVNRDVELVTDSLDYSLIDALGWYDTGGTLRDSRNVLTSRYGNYSPRTKEAEFRHNVRLVNKENNFEMDTDTLFYNTGTHKATIVSITKIKGEKDTIYTRSGWYNTATDEAELNARSLIVHRDSSNNVTTLEGDSIIYDKASRISRAYRFYGPGKQSRPMVITDTAHKSILIGGYGFYNDSTKEAFATDYPMLMEFSRPDTLYLRADSITTALLRKKTEIKNEANIPQIQVDSVGDALSYNAFVELSVSRDSLLQNSPDTLSFSQKEYRVARAFHRARFFRKDLQGVADSIEYVEIDSTMYLFRRPIVWSDLRQVTGPEITVLFNDSTIERADLPFGGIVSESVEDEFYNQLSGKKMRALFTDGEMKRLEADGNVQTIFLPQEKDSTYNKLVYSESGYLSVDMDAKTMKKLMLWPDVSGTAYPIFMIKRDQLYLPGFEWYEKLRPRREWYGDVLHWDDELGEVPHELEEYFNDKSEGQSAGNRRKRIGKQNGYSIYE